MTDIALSDPLSYSNSHFSPMKIASMTRVVQGRIKGAMQESWSAGLGRPTLGYIRLHFPVRTRNHIINQGTAL